MAAFHNLGYILKKYNCGVIDMANIYDYLKWRGDLSFEKDEFNEIDNLVLSILTYIDFGGIVASVDDDESILLKDAYDIYIKSKDVSHLKDLPFLKDIPEFFKIAANTNRFGNISLSSYENQLDDDLSKQFSATVFTLEEDYYFIGFRGTDDNLAGWKEDLQMSFKDEVQSQKEAVLYLNKVLSKFNGEFILGGHSKGGNLAIYATSNVNVNSADRIVEIYSNDGPGFQKEFLEKEGYLRIKDRIISIVPESSVVGLLMEQSVERQVVSSKGITIFQHNPFLWEVMGKSFIYKEGLTKESLGINSTINSWLGSLSNNERENFVNSLFEVIQGTGAKTLSEINSEKLAVADGLIKTFKNMGKETQENLKNVMDLLFQEGNKTFRKIITDDISNFLEKRRKDRREFINNLRAKKDKKE